eukprot:1722271-Pyramimonas_sp.AAC.1
MATLGRQVRVALDPRGGTLRVRWSHWADVRGRSGLDCNAVTPQGRETDSARVEKQRVGHRGPA